MLHTKFQGNGPSGSGEENVLKVFILYGHSSHLGQLTWNKYKKKSLLFALRLHMIGWLVVLGLTAL